MLDYQYYFNRKFLGSEYPAALNVFDELLSKGFDMQQFYQWAKYSFPQPAYLQGSSNRTNAEVGAAIAELR